MYILLLCLTLSSVKTFTIQVKRCAAHKVLHCSPIGTSLRLFAAVIAMLIPFFNDVTGLIGAVGLWPLVVLLPVQMHIKQAGIPKWQPRWLALQFLSMACMIICVGAAVGSIAHIIVDCKDYTPFKTKTS